jgi:hypothetical protein
MESEYNVRGRFAASVSISVPAFNRFGLSIEKGGLSARQEQE